MSDKLTLKDLFLVIPANIPNIANIKGKPAVRAKLHDVSERTVLFEVAECDRHKTQPRRYIELPIEALPDLEVVQKRCVVATEEQDLKQEKSNG